MAFDSFPRHILVWTAIIVGFAAAVELGDDIQTYVPTCAQPCLESFIQGNFPSSTCTSNPTLECLCAAKSSSGYTLGEGALQCISVETQRGVCNETVTGGSVKHDAYVMCSKVANASPNTHSVLTATIADSPTGGSASIILSPTETEAGTVTSIVAPTASSTISMAATTNPAAPSATPAPSPSLNGAQVAGIIVGVAGAIIITVIAILVARHFRRRNFPDLEDGLLHSNDDNNKPGTASSKNTGPMVISAPFRRFSASHPDLRPHHTPPPRFPSPPPDPISPGNPFHTSNPNEDYIVPAISHSQNTTPAVSPQIPPRRPRSRLLPAKPTLSVSIPPVRPPPPLEPLSRPRAAVTRMSSSRTQRTDRTSIMTTNTAFADIDTEIVESDQVWQRPSVPDLTFDDRRGNWVLQKNDSQTQLVKLTEVAELDTYTTKSPHELKEEQALKMAAAISAASALPTRPQHTFLSQDYNNASLNRSSSVYSQASVRRNSKFSGRTRNNSRLRKNNAAQLARSDTMMTHESATTINSCSSSPLDEEVPLDHLSTVAESPGMVPMKFPKTSERINRTNLQVDLPKKPRFATSPPGQPSPTLKGAALIDEEAGSAYPQPLNTRRAQKSPAPNTLRPDSDVYLTGPRYDTGRPLIQSPLSRFSPKAPSTETPPERLRTPPTQTSGSGFSPNPPTIEKFPTPSPLSSRSVNGEGRPHVARAVSPLSFKTKESATSGTSALLAKRVGNGKAAALALAPGNKKKDRWKMQNDQLTPDTAGLSSPKGSLPHTPTWQPRLTPTRHGDDLYINVQ